MKRFARLLLVPILLSAAISCRRGEDAAGTDSLNGKGAALRILVGGTMRPAMEALIKQYTAKTGQKIEMDNGDSGELMIRIEQTRSGDIYVCHDPFLASLQKKRLADAYWTVASLKPIIAVPKGNPKNIAGFRDLARPGMKVIFTDPVYSTAGHIVTRMMERSGLSGSIESNVVSRTRSGGQAANAVGLGTADAAIVWDAVAFLRRDKLDTVSIEPDIAMKKDVDAITSATFGRIDMDYIRVTLCTLRCSKNLEAARAFAKFAASNEARKTWDSLGYSPVDDSRQPVSNSEPELEGCILVHCAAGMRLPVTEMAAAFEKETGVKTQLTFDGSNRLLGQIKLTHKGDVYIAGDAEYVDIAVKDGLVDSRGTVCYFYPVIMTRKGNPHGINTLADMTRPGLKIGQGDPKAAAVGRIMPRLLELNGVDAAAWQKNVVLETATVNDLAVAIKLGTLDAVVVWDAIANKYPDVSEIVPIPAAKNICPEVESAVLTSAANKVAARAFVDFMASGKGRDICRKNGYSVDKPAGKSDNTTE